MSPIASDITVVSRLVRVTGRAGTAFRVKNVGASLGILSALGKYREKINCIAIVVRSQLIFCEDP